MDEEEDDYRAEVYNLDEDDLPFTVIVYDKDDTEVDRIVVEDAGVLEIPKYPEEGRPYKVKIVPNGKTEEDGKYVKPENSFAGLAGFRFSQVPGLG